MSKPMIWREFRAHSICFATRQIVGLFMECYDLWPRADVSATHIMSASFMLSLIKEIAAKGSFLCLASFAAARITKSMGCTVNRTTNSMPYPDHVYKEEREVLKHFYRVAQNYATGINLFFFPATSFAVLYGIQGAAFLMTLVRKGKVSAWGYHKIYSFLLCLPFLFHMTAVAYEITVEVVRNNPQYASVLDTLVLINPKLGTDVYDPNTYLATQLTISACIPGTGRRIIRQSFRPIPTNVLVTGIGVAFHRMVTQRYIITEAMLRNGPKHIVLFINIFSICIMCGLMIPCLRVVSNANARLRKLQKTM